MLDPSILIGPGQPSGSAGPVVHTAANESASDVQRLQDLQTQANLLATIVEIQSGIDSASRLEEAAGIAAQLLHQPLAPSRVMIAWRHGPDQPCCLIADSDHAAQTTGDLKRLVLSAAEECAIRGALTRWPASGNKNRHALVAVQQLAKSQSARSVLGAALIDGDGNNRGAILALESAGDNDATTENTSAEEFLDTIRGPLATKLASAQRLQAGRIESGVRSLKQVIRSEKRRLFAGITLALVMVMMLPLRYRISASCELQPVHRRFVAAPFDGPLEDSLVRPGDLVQQGDLLARINPREIEYELAGVRADLSRARQEKLGRMAEHDTAGSTIAGLESEQLRLEKELLEYRRGNLEIRSPLTGVVVSGDLKQSEGTPLTRGETMFEIAPLGEMVVEVAIDESDFDQVRSGMPVDFYVHAIPNRRFHGQIERIHPKAELRDHENVFIGEVKIIDPEGILRPGMRGRARVTGDRHPLGWNLFHKAYFALRAAVGW